MYRRFRATTKGPSTRSVFKPIPWIPDTGGSRARTAFATAANTASDGGGGPGLSDREILVEEPRVAQPYEHSVIGF
jgi:hypothetical protein